jgi:hypothetical protein
VSRVPPPTTITHVIARTTQSHDDNTQSHALIGVTGALANRRLDARCARGVTLPSSSLCVSACASDAGDTVPVLCGLEHHWCVACVCSRSLLASSGASEFDDIARVRDITLLSLSPSPSLSGACVLFVSTLPSRDVCSPLGVSAIAGAVTGGGT